MPESEVNAPSPELVYALENRTKLIAGIEKKRDLLAKAVGARRRYIDREIEGLEKRIRKITSLIGSLLETEGFPSDYKLPEDDNDETGLAPA